MNLSAIYAAGVISVGSSPVYDPAQPLKTWVRALQPGENPEDDYVYQYPALDNNSPPSYVRWHTSVITKGAAVASNVEVPQPPGTVTSSIVVPIPMEQAKIPAGYALVGTPFGLVLQVVAAPPATASDQDRVLAGVQAILGHLGLPPV